MSEGVSGRWLSDVRAAGECGSRDRRPITSTHQVQENTMPKFDTPAPIATVLTVPAGRIQLIAADRADTTVEVLPADAGKSRDVKAAEQTTVTYADGVL